MRPSHSSTEVFLSLLLKPLCFKLLEVQGGVSHEISHLTVTKERFYHFCFSVSWSHSCKAGRVYAGLQVFIQ